MFPTILFTLFIYSCIFLNSATQHCQDSKHLFFGTQIILFYAPLHSEQIKGQIVIYYFHPKFQLGDRIVLDENNTSSSSIAKYYYRPTKTTGFIFTRISPIILKKNFQSKFIPQFSGYCAYWERNGTKTEKFCLTTQPQWMHLNRHIIGNRTMRSIYIPGTHQSGSYSTEYPQSLVNKFTVAQDQTVLEQLIAGVRYLDLRPVYIDGIFYNAHGFFLMHRMLTIFNDINEFLDNTQEIVIVSFKEFSRGFNDEVHEQFLDLLQIEFKSHYLYRVDAYWTIRLNEIWRMNKRLLIVYNHIPPMPRFFMWPDIPQNWGNIGPGENLQYFIATAEYVGKKPKVTMATYTLQEDNVWDGVSKGIFGGNITSLHSLATSVGPNITQWYNELYYNTTSIVAVDYIQATGIVDFCIEWNKRLSSECSQQYMNQTFFTTVETKF